MKSTPKPTLFLLLVAGTVLLPARVYAHEKWFTDARPYPVQLQLLWSLPVLLGLVAAVCVVGGLAATRRLTGGDNLFPRVGFLRRFDPDARVVLAIQAAITLIYTAVNLHLLVPNLNVPAGVPGYIVAGGEIVVAFGFIAGVYTRLAALLLTALVILAGVLYGPVAFLEQVITIGVAAYLAIVGRGLVYPGEAQVPSTWQTRYSSIAPVILRVCAGFTILVLAFTEKLLNPDLGVAFLRHYPHFNVARFVGITWFTDVRFVFAAGIVELVIGVALMSGILPRLVIIAMFVPFNLPLPFLPATEMIGHLPIFATMYVLLFHPIGQAVAKEMTPSGISSLAGT